jgi:hypothetical protein
MSHPDEQSMDELEQATPAVHTSAWAIASLVLGILSLPLLAAHLGGLALFAVLCGHAARSAIRRGEATGDGLAGAGLITGYLALGITILEITANNF